MKEKNLISYEWAVAIYKGNSPFSLKPTENLQETVLSFEDVTDVQADFVADPFMIYLQNK